MKCPNCYNENEAGRTTCKYCGVSLPYSEPEEIEIEIDEESVKAQSGETLTPVEQYTENTSQDVSTSTTEEQKYQEEMLKEESKKPKKEKKSNKKLKKALIIISILLVLIGGLAGGYYYYTTLTTPDKIYNKAIATLMQYSVENSAIDAKSAELSAKVEVEAPENTALSAVNGFKFDTKIGADLNRKTGLLNLNVKKDDKVYTDISALGDLDHRLGYIAEFNIFDKYVRFDLPEEIVDDIEYEVNFNKLSKRDTQANRNKISYYVQAELSKYMNIGTYQRTKAVVPYGGKNKSVNDDIYTLTEGQYKELLTKALTDLKGNEDFINCFDNKDDIKENIEDALEEIRYFNDDDMVETPTYVRVHLYTTWLKFEFVGVKVEFVSSSTNESLSLDLRKTGDNSYTAIFNGLVDSEEYKVVFDANREVLEDGTTKLNTITNYKDKDYKVDVEYKLFVDEGISAIDMGNVKKFEDLTEEDMANISEKFEESPIHNIVVMALAFITENGFDIQNNTGVDEKTQLPSYIQLADNQSYLITSDAKVVVFELPVAFESNYNGNMYKSYRKNNRIGDRAEVYLNLLSGTDKDKILNDYKSTYDFLYVKEYKTEKDKNGKEYQVELPSKYSDINISEIEEYTINDIVYKTLTVEYTSDVKVKTKYFVTEFNDDYSYVVRVEDVNGIITDSELEKILTITKYVD